MIDLLKKYISVNNIVFFVITILFIIFITKIKDIAILFFASYVIACSLNPLVDKLSKKMKRSAASGVVILGSLLMIILFLIPIIYLGGHQIHAFALSVPDHFENFKAFLLGLPFMGNTELKNLNLSELAASLPAVTSDILSSSITLSKELAAAIVYLLAGCLIVYYFMADKELVKKTYLSLFPKHMKNRADDIIESISDKIGGYVVAQIVTIVSVAVLVTIGLALLGVDYALLLGLLSGLFDIVPVVGPTVAFIIILITVLKLGVIKIALVAFVFLFAQWAENNLVRPYIFSKFLNLHPLIIYFFLFITAQYLGIVGVIFAPAIAATVCVLIEELYIKTIN
jgi:predicted PurR-regulated permease PerM